MRVWDPTAEVRYLVLPERPAGTDAMTEGTTHGAGPGAPRFDDRRRSGICGEVDDGSRYYDHWLVALERLITAKQVLSPSGSTGGRRPGRKRIFRPHMAGLLNYRSG